jgi:hypothetical protein
MDKAKCNNEKCELRHGCKRWTTKGQGERQWVATFYPYKSKCAFYIRDDKR